MVFIKLLIHCVDLVSLFASNISTSTLLNLSFDYTKDRAKHTQSFNVAYCNIGAHMLVMVDHPVVKMCCHVGLRRGRLIRSNTAKCCINMLRVFDLDTQ